MADPPGPIDEPAVASRGRTTFRGLIRLFRLELPVSAGVCVVLGGILAAGALPPLSTLALGFLSFFFISATALILNDYFDLETDRVNAPARPLPAGLVTKRAALVLALAVALAGILAGACISMTAALVVAVIWIVGVAYNWRFKRTGLMGNLMVAFSVGMTFIYGGIVAGHPGAPVVWWFGGLAFLLDLGEEIAADAMDMKGDALIDSRSLAIVLGQRKALIISAVLFGAVVTVSLLPFVFAWLTPAYLAPILLMDGVIVYATVRLLVSRTEERRRYIRWIYLSASVAMVALIVMKVTLG